ncbi:MAG TPA: DUF2142 domain-containing protein [Solirubrobacteraceae bacterium]|nr:DUF2142 domain-containing protein [Solirubrobacteraceae bacterium]
MIFAGDPRVWRVAALVAAPLAALILIWCLVPRDYVTGTNSVNTYTYVAPTPAGQALCVPGLEIPAGTARIELGLISRTQTRPPLELALDIGGRAVKSSLPPQPVGSDRISTAVFPIPETAASPGVQAGSLCLRATDLVNWGGTPVVEAGDAVPTLGGRSIGVGRVAVRYLPPAGSKRSYAARLGAILDRASLFRPGFVGAWLYAVILFLVLPGLAFAAVRSIALAVAGERRRYGLRVFGICAVNAICWALITPAFQVPDEVDHFAYVSSIAEHGRSPDRSPGPHMRWSSAEALAIQGTRFLLDHQGQDTRPPWSAADVSRYDRAVAAQHPRSDDGGGYETASPHGPLYYLALAPAYLLAPDGSVLTQLTLARITSALIGALAALLTYLMCVELAPGRRWLGVLAALLVSFQPMYGFISGGVNNDVGVNAGAALLELLLIRLVLRGPTWRTALLTGVVLVLLPYVKGTAYSLFPVAALAVLVAVVRHHRRAAAKPWVLLAAAAAATQALWTRVSPVFHTTLYTTPGGGAPTAAPAVHQLSGYVSYLWQVFLPRLPFMTPHFQTTWPAYTIFVERGFAAFGFYAVYFPSWVYAVVLAAMLAVPVLAAVAAVRERAYVRRMAWPALLLVAFPAAVVAGFEAAFYTPGSRPMLAEFGRYAFPAIGPLAILVVGSLHAFGRRAVPAVGTGLVVAMIAFSYASQLLTLTAYYA